MYKKHNSFSLIALLFMPRLSEHERPGAIGMLKAGCVFLTTPDTIIGMRQLNSSSESVSMLLGQLMIDTGVISQEWQPPLICNLLGLCIDDIYINDIHSGRLLSVPDK